MEKKKHIVKGVTKNIGKNTQKHANYREFACVMLDNPSFATYNVREYRKTLTETVISLEDRQRAGDGVRPALVQRSMKITPELQAERFDRIRKPGRIFPRYRELICWYAVIGGKKARSFGALFLLCGKRSLFL